ncbi:type II toxin-antitoxin system RelE/ParE family toxin [Stenotrophomonas sp.]|uniref:type II toxin-antitoxin system RelE/ParE family toxin n=1 Tax=Stenotrophomonas sp. TaxID=69392 RepID=UPI0028B10D79|nr:type II toxin-antitoxin system RelE/ParE family toxin [Stenotrophomonas sp.]
MRNPSSLPQHPGTPFWNEPRNRWAAALISALLHLLMLLLLLHSNPPVVSSPQGASGGGRVKVDFVGDAPPSPDAEQKPVPRKPTHTPRPTSKATAQRRSEPRKPVPEARYIEPPAEPEQTPEQLQAQAQPETSAAPASNPADSATRRPQTWTGRPPGSLDRTTAQDNMGRSAGMGDDSGRRVDRSAGAPAMEVGGYQIVYDLLSEEKLRAWMDGAKEVDGKKELSIPLPGTTYLMVCPAEVALRRGSSKCRMLQAGSPELQDIGDARQFVIVMYVYRYGELLWRGPGPYR